MIETIQTTLTEYQVSLVKAALYFDIFSYPLTRDELFENACVKMTRQDFNTELGLLLERKLLTQSGRFILPAGKNQKDITRRLNGNAEAEKIQPTAEAYSRKIASFPFVEAVCISGSLSKNYFDEQSDLDFFIITKPERLWICRTLLILRYKMLPKSKKKFWCTNYFISSDSMALPDINAFTATELAFLVPMVNYRLYKELLSKNIWYKAQFPNKPDLFPRKCMDVPGTSLRTVIEKFFSGRFGKWIDDKLLFYTLRHWQKKYPELASEDFELQFRSRKNVCKRHTKGFQNKVLIAWAEKQRAFSERFSVSLT